MTTAPQPDTSVTPGGTVEATPRRWRAWLGLVVVVVVLWLIVSALSIFGVARRLGAFAGTGPAVTISPETTCIVEPLRDDGYVDYLAALNQRSREGVTPENNAAVLLWQALGPAEIVGTCGEERCDWHFEELGIPRPPEEGEYFVPLQDYASELETDGPPPEQGPSDEQPEPEWQVSRTWGAVLHKQSEEAARRPWTPEQSPELAAWLEKNRKPLELVVAASRKERFYSPLVPGESPPVLGALSPGRHLFREACEALAIRAMLRLGNGQIDEAWQDLLASHRLARLAGDAPTVVEALTAVGMDGIASLGDVAVAHNGNLTPDRARRFQSDLHQLAPLPDFLEKLDVGERFMCLDCISALAREGPAGWADQDGSGDEEAWIETETARRIARGAFDWDLMLRMGNEEFDRMAEACRIADRAERSAAAIEMIDERERELKEAGKPMSLAKSLLTEGAGKTMSEAIGRLLVAMLVPTPHRMFDARDRAATRVHLTEVALALAAYRSDHGSYPDELAQLVPEYLDEVPPDVFIEAELHYAREGDDYVLYSVGPNGQDEEGRDHRSELSGDDVAIRTSPPP